MALDIVVPTLGESVTEASVSQWFKGVGETVKADEPLLELETDKVSIEVNAPAPGMLVEIRVPAGNDVGIGSVLGVLEESNSSNSSIQSSPLVSTPAETPAAANSVAAPTGGEKVEVLVPSLGESITEATVGKWFKAIGDEIILDEPLVELETDKVSVEVNAPATGKLIALSATSGSEVDIGALLGTIEAAVLTTTAAPSAIQKSPANTTEQLPEQAKSSVSSQRKMVPMSPAVRKLISDNDLDPAKISGTGKGNRLTKGDVLTAIQTGTATIQVSAPPASAEIQSTRNTALRPNNPREERVRMTKLRKVIASRLKEAQNTAAMLTTWNEVDMGAAMELRSEYKDQFEKKHGVRLGFMSFFVRAGCIALKEWPAVNAEIYGDEIIYKNYYNIGVAVGTPQGLVVPVIRDADEMRFAEIEGTISDFGRRARDGKLGIDEMMGGTFTISNGGVFGSLNSMPILNVPQSAILGMHTIQKRPVAIRDEVVIRPMMYLALSYDHRIVDGREAVSFLVRMKECIEDPQRIMLDV